MGVCMKIIEVRADMLETLLEEIGSHRALHDTETDLLEDIVDLNSQGFRWNVRTDLALARAAHSTGGIKRFAARYGITQDAAYSRWKRIKARQKRQAARKARKG